MLMLIQINGRSHEKELSAGCKNFGEFGVVTYECDFSKV